jgi:cytidine deaminase
MAGTVAKERKALVRAAAQALASSVARYSGFKVGAALLTQSGDVVTGANVESASYGLTCCAERIALFKALTEGHKEFAAIAVVAARRGGPMPCGACRQLLAEYAPQAKVWVADARALHRVRSYAVRELLPGPFVDFPGGPRRGKTRVSHEV